MRVLITNQPLLGHWHPLVPFARELEARGHEVAFATTPPFASTIETKGFRCFQAGVDPDDDLARIRNRAIEMGLDPEERAAFVWVNLFAVRAEKSLPDLLTIVHDWQPDLIIRDMTEFAGWIAAEHAGVPHAAVQTVAFQAKAQSAVMEPLNRLRASLGMATEAAPESLYRSLLLSYRPPSLQDPAIRLPPTLRSLRYTSFNQSSDEHLPGWVDELPKRPTVYATLGTLSNHRTDIISAILEGLRDEPINLILTVGRDRDPAEFGTQPEHIQVERYIPQSLLLPYCDLVITHGGSGTILDALSLGLPMVVIPIAADQPPNAIRCADLGVARMIEMERRTPQAIRDATREVLQDQSYRQNAQRLRDEIASLPGLDYALALLEQLATEKKPLYKS